MGSPLSPIIANIVMQDIEEKAIKLLGFEFPFFFRYVDDIACAVPNDCVNLTLNTFNSIHPRLQFTIEIGNDDRLNFLDVTLILNKKRIIFDWYHKPSFSGRYLNFYSQHPTCQKRGTVIGLVDRVLKLSHPIFHSKNFSLIIEILRNNSYPMEFIFKCIYDRLRMLTKSSNNSEVTNQKNMRGKKS